MMSEKFYSSIGVELQTRLIEGFYWRKMSQKKTTKMQYPFTERGVGLLSFRGYFKRE